MIVRDALKDKTTNLGRAAAALQAHRDERIEAAKAISEREGISLHDALLRIWDAQVAS